MDSIKHYDKIQLYTAAFGKKKVKLGKLNIHPCTVPIYIAVSMF